MDNNRILANTLGHTSDCFDLSFWKFENTQPSSPADHLWSLISWWDRLECSIQLISIFLFSFLYQFLSVTMSAIAMIGTAKSPLLSHDNWQAGKWSIWHLFVAWAFMDCMSIFIEEDHAGQTERTIAMVFLLTVVDAHFFRAETTAMVSIMVYLFGLVLQQKGLGTWQQEEVVSATEKEKMWCKLLFCKISILKKFRKNWLTFFITYGIPMNKWFLWQSLSAFFVLDYERRCEGCRVFPF